MNSPTPPTPPTPSTPPMPPGRGGTHVFQAPTGTRDFYPAELSRLRYIQEAWRRTSINHGFEEIDGPAFEHLDLYTVKSGEGIVSELFSFERFGGEKTFALRPEFTPTLARMYATKAASLPKPTKWFWQQNCYRAERPQRGRLREFCQWNCDIIGGETTPEAIVEADAECIACCVDALKSLGLNEQHFRVKINDRRSLADILISHEIPEEQHQAIFTLLDRKEKLTKEAFESEARKLSIPLSLVLWFGQPSISFEGDIATFLQEHVQDTQIAFRYLEKTKPLRDALNARGIPNVMLEFSQSVIRGLAYYTGMVFEVHEASGAERAIAGGGRYDKLIEMFGGPPTPAVGFGMGDVVLSLVLQDKGLMPKDEDVAAKLGLNPDALVISNGTPETDGAVAGVIASLRRAGLHARRSYKTSKNIGKLIQDAAKMRARFCVILESATAAQVKDMGTQAQEACSVAEIAAKIGR